MYGVSLYRSRTTSVVGFVVLRIQSKIRKLDKPCFVIMWMSSLKKEGLQRMTDLVEESR